MFASSRSRLTLGLAVLTVLGAVLRASAALRAPFPLGDGGLFASAIDAIRAEGGALPAQFAFNGYEIPFVYPPVGLWLAAAAGMVGSFETTAILRFVPVLLAVAMVPAAGLAVRSVTGSVGAGILAAALVAVMPGTYDQVVAGGGVTRGAGMVAALASVALAAGSDRWSGRLGAGVAAGLAILSHPQVGVFATVSLAAVLVYRRTWVTRHGLFATAGGILLVVLPWIILIAARGQLESLLNAGQRAGVLSGAVGTIVYPAMQSQHGGILDIGVAFSAVGVLAGIAFGAWQPAAWLLLAHVAQAPIFASLTAWAMAGAAGLAVLGSRLDVHHGLLRRGDRPAPWTVVAIAIALALAVAGASASPTDPGSKQQHVTSAQLAVQQAISLDTDARLAVVTSQEWGNDIFGEWLPYVANQAVTTTAQGTEWLGREPFERAVEAHRAFERCAPRTSECVAELVASGTHEATHVVVPGGSVGGLRAPDDCCPALRESIRVDPRFEIILDAPGGLVARWVGP